MSYIKTFGTRKEVFNNKALKTTGGLKKVILYSIKDIKLLVKNYILTHKLNLI